MLVQAGLTWFKPDSFARALVDSTGCSQLDANVLAWNEGLRRLDEAVSQGRNHAFESTLGGKTRVARIEAAARSHDVMVWYCGLATPERHVARVKARVAADIPKAMIPERWQSSMMNLILLLPHLAHLQVYDNSEEVAAGEPVPDPVLLAEMVAGGFIGPVDAQALRGTPDWAKPLLVAAPSLADRAAVA